MILMILFLALTVAFVISTVIYLNKKKKSDNVAHTKATKDTKEKASKKTNKRELADILQMKIHGNIIKLGNRYSCVIRLGNIDYNILAASEQEAVETVLIQTALSIDYPIQFFTTTEFIDTSKVIDTIRENKPINQNIKDYQNYLINYLQNLMENRSISVVRNYAIISYDGQVQNAEDELNRRTASFKNSLLRAKVSCDILDEADLYNLIYRELNKNSSLKIDKLREGVKNLYVGKKQKVQKSKH